MNILLTSFSFKRKLPEEANMVFDVRFLKNPFYDLSLKPKTGLDAEVGAHIESDRDFADFYASLTKLISQLMPRFVEIKRESFSIAIGCTGGQHRSVYVVEKLGGFLRGLGYKVTINHRELK